MLSFGPTNKQFALEKWIERRSFRFVLAPLGLTLIGPQIGCRQSNNRRTNRATDREQRNCNTLTLDHIADQRVGQSGRRIPAICRELITRACNQTSGEAPFELGAIRHASKCPRSRHRAQGLCLGALRCIAQLGRRLARPLLSHLQLAHSGRMEEYSLFVSTRNRAQRLPKRAHERGPTITSRIERQLAVI